MSFQNNTVFGSAAALNVLEFQVAIIIYGMNDTRDLPSLFNRKHSLFPERRGFIQDEFAVNYNDYEGAEENYNYEDEGDFLDEEKMVVNYGKRREGWYELRSLSIQLLFRLHSIGDKLLHTDFKIGERANSHNNSLTFYYIDRNLLTCAKFILSKVNLE